MKSLSILLLSSLALVAHAGKQTVGVRGTFMCGNAPLSGVTVKLWDDDRGPDPDDLMAEGTTDKNGHFELFGTESEWSNIEPQLKVYHRCNNKGWFDLLPNICQRKNVFIIPDSYINRGTMVGKWYEMGTVNMEAKMKGEDTECI